MTDKHRVFISYYHQDDQIYKNKLQELSKAYDIFDDFSVNPNDIDDTNLTSEKIRQIIRDEYLRDSTVTIVLVGKNTAGRKHVDWEIHASMIDTTKISKSGILVVNLPTISQSQRANDDHEKEIIVSRNWITLNSRSEYINAFQYMPSRIIDNFVNSVPICVVDWNIVISNPQGFKNLIDFAFKRRNTNHYDTSSILRGQNSPLKS